jgi:hypothetical protein
LDPKMLAEIATLQEWVSYSYLCLSFEHQGYG